jgi:oligopeptide/dipeptide ABC transporter ATP-binding protein
MPDPLLKVQNLQTFFHTDEGVARAVDGVSFALYPQQTLAIVGESGCGKSVTSMSIMRLLQTPPAKYEGGQILFKGQDLLQLPERDMQKVRGGQIAMIFQEPMTSLNPVFTIGNQIIEAVKLHQSPPSASQESPPKTDSQKQAVLQYMDPRLRNARNWYVDIAVDALQRVGISEPARRLSEYPHQMSGGMKQRVMIAMALACNPSLLIADEPTTALDVTIQAQILELLRKIQDESGMAVLLITHDLGVVAENADVVAVMYAGKIVEYADVYELFANPIHPYTKGLLACVPKLGDHSLPHPEASTGRLFTIPGMVPSATKYPPGCRFAPRCTECTGDIRKKEEAAHPDLREVKPGHWVATWNAPNYASAPAPQPDLSFRRSPASPPPVQPSSLAT